MTMVKTRKAKTIAKIPSTVSLAQAIEECKKEVERNVNAESDPMLRGILGIRMDISVSDIAARIERKDIEAVIVRVDSGDIDPIRTTVTKVEAARWVDFVRSALADTKANYMAQKKYASDPANLPERQAGFYKLHEPAALAGLTALEAANLLLTLDGELLERFGIPCKELDAPPLAKRLLTLEEMQQHGPEDIHRTIHPLGEWLLRAKVKGIEYIPGLDFAVAQCSGGTVNTTNAEQELENWKMRVQEEAAKRWRAQRALSCNPNRNSLKDELATWCKANNVVTKQGINPTADYLYRHVLSSRHWTPPTD